MMVTTIYGPIEEASLEKTTGVDETEDALVRWVEYRLPNTLEIVHRSVHADVKATAAAFAKGDLF